MQFDATTYTTNRCLKYDSTRNFYYQIDNIIMRDLNKKGRINNNSNHTCINNANKLELTLEKEHEQALCRGSDK